MWIGPYEWMWWGVLILYGLTELLWFFRDGYCILTDIERYFRQVPRPDNATEQNFITRLLKSFFGFEINPRSAQIFTRFWEDLVGLLLLLDCSLSNKFLIDRRTLVWGTLRRVMHENYLIILN